MSQKETKELRKIPGYPNYSISKDGDIIATNYEEPKKLNTFKQVYDYEIVNISNEGDRKTHLVHQLVMLTWGPKRPYPERDYRISHIDGDKSNNHIDNLRWIHKTQVNSGKANPIKAIGIDEGDKIYFRRLTDAANYFRTDNATIRKNVDNETTYKGYKFFDIK